VTRDYVLELDRSGAPLMSVYGGKLTTYRKLAEDVIDELAPLLGADGTHWTADAPLPGGDMPGADFAAFLDGLAQRYGWLPPELRRRLARAYGTRLERLLDGAHSLTDLGAQVLPGLFEREIDYLVSEEMALDAEDILWRRSKLGLHLPANATRRLDDWMTRRSTVVAV
jgi:glycerol-3-phosphate dehydrogenase